MKIGSLINEVLDISRLKQASDIQNSLKKINGIVNANPVISKEIGKEVSNIGTDFASILAQTSADIQAVAAQENAANEEKKKKDFEERLKLQQKIKQQHRSGIGTSLPITKPEESSAQKKLD